MSIKFNSTLKEVNTEHISSSEGRIIVNLKKAFKTDQGIALLEKIKKSRIHVEPSV